MPANINLFKLPAGRLLRTALVFVLPFAVLLLAAVPPALSEVAPSPGINAAGDGLPQAPEMPQVRGFGTVRISTTRLSFAIGQWLLLPELYNTAKVRLTGDFNGDTFADLLLANGEQVFIFLSDGMKSFRTAVISLPLPAPGRGPILLGDTDGDRCADLVLWDSSGHFLQRGRSDCRGAFLWDEPLKDALIESFGLGGLIDPDGNGRKFPALKEASAPKMVSLKAWEQGRLSEVAPFTSALTFLHAEGAGFGSFNGDRVTQLLIPASRGEHWYLSRQSGELSLFAAFPAGVAPYYAAFGDLNGDGRTDLTIRGKELKGWWVGLSNGNSALEMSVAWPFPGYLEIDSIMSADFNGDGFDDILGHGVNPESIWVALSEPPRGVPLVSISTSAGPQLLADQQGLFPVAVPANGSLTLQPILQGYHFVPREITVFGDSAKLRPINFFAVKESPNDGLLGRAVRLDGDYPGPYLCTGYHPTVTEKLPNGLPALEERGDRWGMESGSCPPGYAFLNVHAFDPSPSGRLRGKFEGNCCRLPEADILTDRSFYVDNACPEDSIATGARPPDASGKTPSQLRCTAINRSRYRLGETSQGKSWGIALGMQGDDEMIPKSAIPVTLRFGAGRQGFDKWDIQGCLGIPWGSLFTAADAPGCKNFKFRQLLYVEKDGDRPAGSPVVMFPPCRSVENIFDPAAGCRP